MKKEIFILTAVAIVIVSSMVLSCNKEDRENVDGKAGNTFHLDCISPFDYIGEAHNTILYSLGQEMVTDFENFISLEEKHTADRDALTQKIFENLPSIISNYLHSEFTMEEIMTCMSLPFENNGENDFFESEVATEVQKVFRMYGEIEDLDEFCNSIRLHEIEITKMEMSRLDSQVVACLNIFYHSSLFWKDATNNEENPWHILVSDLHENATSYVYTGTKGLVSGIIKFCRNAAEWVSETYRNIKEKYTWKNILIADAGGAVCGAAPWISTPTNGSSILISAVASSAVGPLFM